MNTPYYQIFVMKKRPKIANMVIILTQLPTKSQKRPIFCPNTQKQP